MMYKRVSQFNVSMVGVTSERAFELSPWSELRVLFQDYDMSEDSDFVSSLYDWLESLDTGQFRNPLTLEVLGLKDLGSLVMHGDKAGDIGRLHPVPLKDIQNWVRYQTDSRHIHKVACPNTLLKAPCYHDVVSYFEQAFKKEFSAWPDRDKNEVIWNCRQILDSDFKHLNPQKRRGFFLFRHPLIENRNPGRVLRKLLLLCLCLTAFYQIFIAMPVQKRFPYNARQSGKEEL